LDIKTSIALLVSYHQRVLGSAAKTYAALGFVITVLAAPQELQAHTGSNGDFARSSSYSDWRHQQNSSEIVVQKERPRRLAQVDVRQLQLELELERQRLEEVQRKLEDIRRERRRQQRLIRQQQIQLQQEQQQSAATGNRQQYQRHQYQRQQYNRIKSRRQQHRRQQYRQQQFRRQ
jgi:hypothetical protein